MPFPTEHLFELPWALENFSVVAENEEEGNDKMVTLLHRPLQRGTEWVVAKARCVFSFVLSRVSADAQGGGWHRVSEEKAIVWVYKMQHCLCEGCCSVEE